MKKLLLSIVALSLVTSLSTSLVAQTTGTLTFHFTEVSHGTATYNGNAQHVLAVWIQNAAGTFIKTKNRYVGSGTKDHLPTWAVNSGGTASNATAAACNVADATTGATLASWTTKTIVWDGKTGPSATATVVPDGTYKITLQSTWDHGSGGTVTSSFTFVKGPAADHQTPATTANFSGMTLDWVPTPSGINDVVADNQEINVYPNPTNGMFNVDFQKASSIKVVNVLGAVIFEEKVEQASSGTKSIDLTNFANGIYFIYVYDGEKFTNRKLILNK